LRRPRTNAKAFSQNQSPAVSAGLFLCRNFRRAYLETRSLDSDVPIGVNAAAIWLDGVTVENLSELLAQHCRTAEVGWPSGLTYIE